MKVFPSIANLYIWFPAAFLILAFVSSSENDPKSNVLQPTNQANQEIVEDSAKSLDSTVKIVDYSRLDYRNVVDDKFDLKISANLFKTEAEATEKLTQIQEYVSSHPISPCRQEKDSKDLSEVDFGVVLCDHRSRYAKVWDEYMTSHKTYIHDLQIYARFLASQIERKIGTVILDKDVAKFLSLNIRHLIKSIKSCITVTDYLHRLMTIVYKASAGPEGSISPVESEIVSYAFNEFSTAYEQMLPHLVLLLNSYSAAVSFLRPVKKVCFNSGLVKPVQRTAKLTELFDHFDKLPTLMDIFHVNLFKSIGININNRMPSRGLLPPGYFKPEDLYEVWSEKVTVAELKNGQMEKYRKVSLVFNTWYMRIDDDTTSEGESMQLGAGLDPEAKRRMTKDVERQWLSDEPSPIWDLHAYTIQSKGSISGDYIKLVRKTDHVQAAKHEIVIKVPRQVAPMSIMKGSSFLKRLKYHQKLSLPQNVLKFFLK